MLFRSGGNRKPNLSSSAIHAHSFFVLFFFFLFLFFIGFLSQIGNNCAQKHMTDRFTRDPSLDSRHASLFDRRCRHHHHHLSRKPHVRGDAFDLIPHVHPDACVTAFKDNMIQCVISIMNEPTPLKKKKKKKTRVGGLHVPFNEIHAQAPHQDGLTTHTHTHTHTHLIA